MCINDESIATGILALKSIVVLKINMKHCWGSLFGQPVVSQYAYQNQSGFLFISHVFLSIFKHYRKKKQFTFCK